MKLIDDGKEYRRGVNKNKLLDLRRGGKTYQEIGNELGISSQRVHQLLTGYKSPVMKKSPSPYRGYMQGWRATIKSETLTHYGGGKLACVVCGENHPACLTIDHRNGGGNKHRRELGRDGCGFYSWLKRNNYPEGFQTLCMNCQFKKAYQNRENNQSGGQIS